MFFNTFRPNVMQYLLNNLLKQLKWTFLKLPLPMPTPKKIQKDDKPSQSPLLYSNLITLG